MSTNSELLRKNLSKSYSFIFPKPNNAEYTTKELIGGAIVWGTLLICLALAAINCYIKVEKTLKERSPIFKEV